MRTLHGRLLGLVFLLVLGVGLATAGGMFDIDDSLASTEPGGEFVVSENEVSFVASERATTVENLTAGKRVEIREDDDAIAVETTGPLSEAERELAAEVARNNDTVATYLERADGELDVEPVRRLDTNELSEGQEIHVEVDVDEESSGEVNESFDATFEVVEAESDDSSVTIDTDPTYAEDEAAVRIYGSDDELRYSLSVDLTTESIERFTDRS